MVMDRRQFAITSVCGLAGLLGACRPKEEIIDIHQHLGYSGRSDEDFLEHQDTMGITRSVLLPSASYLTMFSTHMGRLQWSRRTRVRYRGGCQDDRTLSQ